MVLIWTVGFKREEREIRERKQDGFEESYEYRMRKLDLDLV